MHKPLLALAAALLATTADAGTLIHNANGVQVDAYGEISRFTGVLIGDDGKVERLVRSDEPPPAAAQRIEAGGRTLLSGLIDAHGHVMGLGQAASILDLTGTRSLEELQHRLKDYAADKPGEP